VAEYWALLREKKKKLRKNTYTAEAEIPTELKCWNFRNWNTRHL